MMLEKRFTEFIEELSSAKPVPGGGGACAAAGALASALGMMVANLTVGKKRYAEVDGEVRKILTRLETLQKELIVLADKDAEAFEPLSKAYGLPKETQEDRDKKEQIMEVALYEAGRIPLEIMKTSLKMMCDLRFLGEKGSRIAVSDVGVAILFAQAALEGASLNVFINTRLMKNRERAEEMNQKAEAMIQEGLRQKEEIYASILEKLR